MCRLLFVCVLTLSSAAVLAQGTSETSLRSGNSILAEDVLKQGQREVNGGFALTAGERTSYNITAGYAHFWRDRLAFSGDLELRSFGEKVSYGTSLGVQYYFAMSGALAPFVAQHISVFDGPPVAFSGKSKIGVLYLISPNVGFKTFGQFSYPLEELKSPTFTILGEFAIYL